MTIVIMMWFSVAFPDNILLTLYVGETSLEKYHGSTVPMIWQNIALQKKNWNRCTQDYVLTNPHCQIQQNYIVNNKLKHKRRKLLKILQI